MIQSAFIEQPTRGTTSKQFWLTPPELYAELDEEFHFDFDPCPFPRQGFDGLRTDWGQVNFVNAPYSKKDGEGFTRWLNKSIEEHDKGKTVVLLKPCLAAEYKMFQRQPEIRCIGRVPWLATDGSGERRTYKQFVAVIMRGEPRV